MFLLRQALPRDLDDLHALAKQTYFINLPPDRDIIAQKIEQSLRSFQSLASGKRAQHAAGRATGAAAAGIRQLTSHSDLFLIVLEDVEGRGVIGTSQVISRMGGPGSPRVSLVLGEAKRRSETLKLEWTHQVATIACDETGPTEIGGLILNHAFRGHRQRLGRLLSFVRFHLIGLHRARFADRIIAEMLGAIDKNGYSPFFEKFTRHFIPRSFAEVYRFSQTSKEFITGLMPDYPLDLTIMDPEVANAAGEVSEETLPARRILERLGFKYFNHIDPLDGGPHLEAPAEAITLIRQTRRIKSIAPAPRLKGADLLVSTLGRTGDFRAVQASGSLAAGKVLLRKDAAAALLPEFVSAGATPMPD